MVVDVDSRAEFERARDQFLETGVAGELVRPVVADSWVRSAAAGVDADANLAPLLLEASQLRDYRAEHPLSRVFPLLYDVLGRVAEDCEYVMAVGDAEGQLLWVCGHNDVLRRAESINFVEGSAWDETSAGTNAPGMTVRLDRPVQIQGSEHFNRLVQQWSCAAAPIHDPQTQSILGLVDITGGEDVASPQTLGLVRAAARMAEAELARMSAVERRPVIALGGNAGLWSPHRQNTSETLHLQGLGRPDCIAVIGARSLRLSRRHSEILAVLVDHPEGLTGEQLELEVYAADVHRSTMRAEMTRLRALLGPQVLQSKPYRLVAETVTDWHAVSAHLSAGHLREALKAYVGPLLPASDAPGIERRRDVLATQIRAAVLNCGEADLMVAWTRSRWGADDLQMWQRQAAALPATSPLRAMAAAEAVRLEHDLG